MITLKVKVTFVEEVLGMASSDPDIHSTYIASQAPDALTMKEEVEAIGPEEVFEKSMTIFPKDKETGNPIIWDYQWRGFFKDAFGALKLIPEVEGCVPKNYKKVTDKLIIVEPRKIPIDVTGEMGTCQRPLRASTAQGERIALASSETVPAGSSVIFTIRMLSNTHEKAVMEALKYGRFRGFGQWRNSGKGKFAFEILERKEEKYA